ncbi:hypothetical protein [Clostridium sp. JS66]|uniref:hypothetical protein n=1 Tax=Clostridium sp. JS66 TaxID=3064705 RepID=UPI00298E5CB7|nr:hypothetical protein [Clostridium sp. JS66]WPC42847.1 hypothetical protein Q6H37_05080 [Clostridium sp. JS66]
MGTSKGYIPPKDEHWRKAKLSVTNMVKNRMDKSFISKAVADYGQAYTKTNLNNSVIVSAGARLMDFISLFNDFGFEKALDEVGLSNLVGKDSIEVYLGLLDYFSGDNSTVDKSIVRDCMADILENMDLEGKDDLDKIDGDELLKDFIIKYIQFGFQVSFSEKIEGLVDDIDEMNQIINDVNEYIEVSIVDNYKTLELSEINWKAEEGLSFVKDRCNEAFDILITLRGE